MKKPIHYLLLCLLFLPVTTTAQTKAMIEKVLLDNGMENISCTENDSVCILTAENNVWRINGIALQHLITQLPVNSKPIQIILLENNIPQIVLSATQSSRNIKDWTISYKLDKSWKKISHQNKQNNSLFKIDLVLYPEIAFRNIKLDRIYDWLVNISPAVEFSAWKGMKFTGQVIFPLVNQYGEQYKEIRPGFITLSQQVRLPSQWFAKATVGIFDQNRWGADLKIFHPFPDERFALRIQAGLTGASSFRQWQWYYSTPKRVTYSLGTQYYNPRYNVQCNLSAGRYLAGDYGIRTDIMRHFRYTTIGFFGLKTNKSEWNGGFYFTIALPPYKQKRSRVRLTTAPHFDIEYNAAADFYYGKTYKAEPGENPSQSNFNPYFLKSEIHL